jgi:L-iditol 2-dehydrogenase
MKAVMKVARGVGNVELRDIPEPEPGPGQVAIEVAAAGICGTDLHIYKDEFGSNPPVVLGHETAGVVAAAGQGVDPALTGKRVTTETYFYTCGTCQFCRGGFENLCLTRKSIGSHVNGAFTRYLVVPAHRLHVLPDGIDLEAGALTEPLACVVHNVQINRTVNAGDIAVVAGPGAIGLLAAQVVKAAGATVVVLGTNRDANRLQLAGKLGADYTLNIEQDSPAELIGDITPNGLGADVVYECSGAGPAATQLLGLVRRQGIYAQMGIFGGPIRVDFDQVVYKELSVFGTFASLPESWTRALQLMASGAVQTKPLITHRFSVTAWRQAFDLFEEQAGIKTVLKPVL